MNRRGFLGAAAALLASTIGWLVTQRQTQFVQRLRIRTNGPRARIYLNDKEVIGAKHYTIEHHAGDVPRLLIEGYPVESRGPVLEGDITGEAVVTRVTVCPRCKEKEVW
jgi:hypothetical protein